MIRGHLQEFVFSLVKPSETKVKKGAPEFPQLESQAIQYWEINAIFDASPIEGPTSRERAIYINEARMSKYPTVLTGPPLAPSEPISFSDSYGSAMHFSHNDDLIVIMIIGKCRASKILVDGGAPLTSCTEAP